MSEYNLEDCFICYLDVLGVKNLLKEIENGENKKLLEDIIKVIKINSKITKSTSKETSKDGNLDIRSFYFSDSFAFIMKKEPRNLPHLFLIVRYLQDRFWEKGFCFRGAITVGKMYFPKKEENVLIGPGLVEAYKLESEIAIYPRIVVDEKLVEYIKNKNIKGSPFLEKQNDGFLINGIKKDKDGIYFLDLLNRKVLRKIGENIINENKRFSIVWNRESKSNYERIIGEVEEIVEKNINSTDEKVKQKYEWLKSYVEEIKSGAENG